MHARTIRFPDELDKDLKAKARREGGRSVASVIRDACYDVVRNDRNFTQADLDAWNDADEEVQHGRHHA